MNLRLAATALALLATAACSSAGEDPDTTTDAGTSVDAGTTPDAGPTGPQVVEVATDPKASVEVSFESPAVAVGSTIAANVPALQILHAESSAIVRLSETDLLGAPADGKQVLAITTNNLRSATVRASYFAMIQPGEIWAVAAAVGFPVDGPSYQVRLVVTDGLEHLVEPVGVSPKAGTPFQSLEVAVSNAGTTARPIYVSFDVDPGSEGELLVPGMAFLDHLIVKRTTAPEGTAVAPYVPEILNPSFELPLQGSDGFTPNVAGWTSTSTGDAAVLVYRPTERQYTQAQPLASPAEGSQLLELGSGGGGAFTLNVESTPFARAAAGTPYVVHLAFGTRADVAACAEAKLRVVSDAGVVKEGTLSSGVVPKGGWGTYTLTLGDVAEEHVGKLLRVALAMTGAEATEACRIDVDAVTAGVVRE